MTNVNIKITDLYTGEARFFEVCAEALAKVKERYRNSIYRVEIMKS